MSLNTRFDNSADLGMRVAASAVAGTGELLGAALDDGAL